MKSGGETFSNWIDAFKDSAYGFVTFFTEWGGKIGSSDLFQLGVVTAVSAFAGAYGAWLISTRNNNKNKLLEEIRNVNAAIMTVFYICNQCLALKSQYVKELKENFDKKRQECNEYKFNHDQGNISPGDQFEYEAELSVLSPLDLPVHILENQIFERISSPRKVLHLVSTLITTIKGLDESIVRRNSLIEEVREKGGLPEEEMVCFYFGLPNSQGHIIRQYPDTLDQIYKQTDSCIFYSSQICNLLQDYGSSLRPKSKSKKLVVNAPDFTEAYEKGLMPDEKDFADMVEMIKG